MTVVRWQPVRESRSLHQEINRLFGTLLETPTVFGNGGTARHWIPAMDLVENDEGYVLRADLPGLSEDDVKIELEENVLTISGERKTESEQRKGGYVRVERASGSFKRSLTLPSGVDPQSVAATFDAGVLEITIPKPAERKPHRVAIASRTVEGSETAPASDEPAAA